MSLLESSLTSVNAEVAHKWFDEGIAVFPCCSESKRPLVKEWRNGKANSSEWLRCWDRNPSSMPGLDCSSAEMVVIDCDRRDDRDGEAEFVALCGSLGVDVADVPTVRTPSGGRHYYFRRPAGCRIPNSASQLANGVDVRGDGGFVVVPGARRADGREYVADHPQGLAGFIRAVAERALPDLPEALLRRFMRTPPSVVVPFPQQGPFPLLAPDNTLSAGVQQRWDLAEACLRVATATPGQRNHVLNLEAFTAGLRCSAGALDPADAYERLWSAAKAAGLDDDEISRTLSAALQRGTVQGSQNQSVAAQPDFERTTAGLPKRTYNNAILAVKGLGIEARRNTFSDKIFLSNIAGAYALPDDHVGPLSENAVSLLRKVVQDTFGFDPGKEFLVDAIKSLAEEARYDPVVEWLDGLEWDGTRRLHDWLPRITGAPATPLFKKAGVLLLMGMVVRARYPGSKFDLCLVLEGRQGGGKSSLVRLLASGPGEGYFVDAPGLIAMENKARAELLYSGPLIG